MAIYRNIHITFWTDPKVVDDFTPEDRYFYIYLLTNPHTNLCGCYEISLKQMSDETGYNKESIEKLLRRFNESHKVIAYDKDTRELLIYNWHKYNWTKSPKFEKAVRKEIAQVKSDYFKALLEAVLDGGDTVSIPYQYPMDTTVTATVTDTVTGTVTGIGKQPQETQGTPPQNPPVITIILDTGEEYPIYQNDIDEWKELYPDVNVVQELRKMKGWSKENPAKRKTKDHIRSFINRWLATEQDKIQQKGITPQNTCTPQQRNRFTNFTPRNYTNEDMRNIEKQLLQHRKE